MGCNWEMYELRLMVWTTAKKSPAGRFTRGQVGVQFDSVGLDLATLSMQSVTPKDSTDACSFKAIFDQLAKLKTIPFGFSRKIIKTDRFYLDPPTHFMRLQTAEQKNEVLPAAVLYVHKRGQSDHTSITTGIGVLLEDVTVTFTSSDQNSYYVQLFGASGKTVNF